MDRGRMIDHVQNVNAKNFDNFSKGKTSIKLFHPPGGEDHLQLGWDYNEPEELNNKDKQEIKKHVYEPAFVMPKKEYTKSYHVNKYIVEEDEKEKINTKKSFNNEQQKIKSDTNNENTKKEKEEIKEVIKCKEVKKKDNIKPINKEKEEDDPTKGGRIMIFNMGK